MVANSKANGRLITCMAKDYILGKMAVDMKEDISRIRSMDMEFMSGLMADLMKVTGFMESNMDKASISCQMVLLK